jgi:hypothetical protein
MSTEGAGKCCKTVNALPMAALGAAVGAYILIDKGIMWFGEQLDKNYNKRCQEYTNAVEAVRASSRAQASMAQSYLPTQIEALALEQAHQHPQVTTTTHNKQADKKALLAAFAQAREAVKDARESVQASREARRKLLIARLRAEIELARNLLPSEAISSAEEAINGTTENVRAALERLQRSWQYIRDNVALQERQRRQTQQIMTAVTNQLRLIDTMQQGIAEAMPISALELRHKVETLIANAQSIEATDPDQAHEHILQAQKVAHKLFTMISTQVLAGWDSLQSEANVLLGTLTALARMIEEALLSGLADLQHVGNLRKHLADLRDEIQVRNADEGIIAERKRFSLLTERVTLLKQDIFTFIGQRQQRQIAQTIATTLSGLGYTPSGSGQSMLHKNGELIRVEATRVGKASELTRDDKIVSFDIASNGDITYDFSGFVGDSCIKEVIRVFRALKAKGVYILDSQEVQRLADYPVDMIDSNLLEQKQFQPHIEANKLQASLSARLYDVLTTMNYQHIVQNTVGGCIELDAFNESIGYHIVLDPAGDTQVFNNGVDVSSDNTDPIVAEINPLDNSHESDTQESSPKKTSRGYTPHNKPQRLDNSGR